MARNEQRRSAWSAVKHPLSELERDPLVALLRDLYELSPSNKSFVLARLGRQEALADYKKVIAECMYPDADRAVRIAQAKKAISQYRKAASDGAGEIDLMIHFVECGNKFTLDYGDINENFYDSLLDMYARAVKTVAGLPDSEQETFRQRLWKLTESSDGIGWGYHDGLCDEYYSAFPDRDA